MIAVLLLAVLAITVQAVVYDRARRADQLRVDELLTLLEAKAAPAEVAAYVYPYAEPEDTTFITTPDGLITVAVDDG